MEGPPPRKYHSVDGTTNNATTTTTRPRGHSTENSLASLEELMNKDDQAERGLLHSMEQRRSYTQTGVGDTWHASVQGERPPLGGAVPLQPMMVSALHHSHGSNSFHSRNLSEVSGQHSHNTHNNNNSQGSQTSQNSATKLSEIARRMRQKAATGHHHDSGSSSMTSSITGNTSHTTSNNSHRRAPSRVHALLDSIQEQPDESGSNDIFDGVGGTGANTNNNTGGDGNTGTNNATTMVELDQAASSTDRLLTGAMQVEDLFEDNTTSPTEAEMIVEEEIEEVEEVTADDNGGERVPLTSASYSYQNGGSGTGGSDGNSNNSSTTSPTKSPKMSTPTYFRKSFRKKAVAKKKSYWWQSLRWTCCHPLDLCRRLWYLLWYQTHILTVTFPCCIMALMFYYVFEDPRWTFMPGAASVAWWCNFVGRQIVLMEVSRLCQWLLIDNLVLGTRIAVQCLGPLLTLCFIQSRGWPFCITAWGFLDLLILEGKSDFERHWFYFLPFKIYNHEGDSGSYILSSDYYIRLLLSMMLAGIATAMKRTTVAMYFGRRTFVEFKPRLEKLLKEVVLVSELAALAEEAEIAASEEEEIHIAINRGLPHHDSGGGGGNNNNHKVKILGDVSWNNKKRGRSRSPHGKAPVSGNSASDSEDEDEDEDDDASEITTQHDIRPDSERFGLRQNSSGSLGMKELLDHWDEPINKMDKVCCVLSHMTHKCAIG